jgi:hypothetical protein
VRVSFEGDPAEAARWTDKAVQELARLKQRMEVQGLESGKFQHVLDSDTGAYCMGYVLPGGIEAVHVVTVPGVQLTSSDSFKSITPDFVSGAVIEKRIVKRDVQRVIQGFFPTIASARVHNKELHLGKNSIPRLAVDPFPGFEDITIDWSSNGIEWSQYFSVMPGLYSGKMRGVVQFLLGVGKRPYKTSVYDPIKFKGKQPTATDKSFLSDIAVNGMRVGYDFRFLRTHGITTAADGKLWVVEVSASRGILAMPLPIDPITAQPEFARKVAELGDTDAQTVLDTYGGFPSGEYMPSSDEALQAYIRAGRVIRLASASDLAPFYACEMYSSSMGWAFSLSGTQAHNTAYYYHADNVQRGVHYAINMQIGSTRLAPQDSSAEQLKGSFSKLSTDPRFAKTFEANMWKIDHMAKTELLTFTTLTAGKPLDQKYITLDQTVLSPLATGSASVGKMGEGKIYWPTVRCPQIKFPEPILGYLLSHDMRAAGANTEQHTPSRIDTVMHVFFAGEELKWARFFSDRNTLSDSATLSGYDERFGTDFDVDYLPAGDLFRESARGPFGIPSMFYTNDFDDRRVLGTQHKTIHYKRRDLGYYEIIGDRDGPGNEESIFSNTWFPNPGPGHLAGGDVILDPPIGVNWGTDGNDTLGWRNKWFSWESFQHTDFLPLLDGAIAVPFFDREAMYYAHFEGSDSQQDTYTYDRMSLTDPNVVHCRYNGRFDDPRIVVDNRFVEDVSAYPGGPYWYGAVSAFADNGQWIGEGANFTEIATKYAPSTGSFHKQNTIDTPGVGTHTVYLISSALPQALMVNRKVRSDIDPHQWKLPWYVPSPDPDTGITAYIAETPSCLGQADLIVYMKDIPGGSATPVGTNIGTVGEAPPGADFSNGIPTIIGVIN